MEKNKNKRVDQLTDAILTQLDLSLELNKSIELTEIQNLIYELNNKASKERELGNICNEIQNEIIKLQKKDIEFEKKKKVISSFGLITTALAGVIGVMNIPALVMPMAGIGGIAALFGSLYKAIKETDVKEESEKLSKKIISQIES